MKLSHGIRRLALAALLAGYPWPAAYAVIGEKPAVAASPGASPAASPAESPSGLVGIGAVLTTEDGSATVRSLVPGGPAARDGRLKADDRITAVAQGDGAFVDCKNLTLDKVVGMIRGNKGSTVRLKVLEPGVTDPKQTATVTLVREEVKLNGTEMEEGGNQTANLSADEKKQLDTLIGKVNDARRTMLGEQMKKEVDDVAKATGLNDAGKQALEKAADTAVQQSIDQSTGKLKQLFTHNFGIGRHGIFEHMLNVIIANASAYAKWAQSQGGAWPADQAAWKDALKTTLDPAQAAAWAAVEKQRGADAEVEMGHYLDTLVQFTIQQQRPNLEAKAAQVQQGLNLAPDRAAKLKAMTEALLKEAGQQARESAKKGLLAMGENERKTAIEQQGFYRWLQGQSDEDWDKSLATLLTKEEIQQLKDSHEEEKQRRARAMGDLAVALMDDRIAFTEAQRGQIEPIIERLAAGNSNMMGDRENNSYYNTPVSAYYGLSSGASEAEIKPILDSAQWQHWRDCCAEKNNIEEHGVETVLPLPTPADSDKSEAGAQPEDVDRDIADYVQKKSHGAYRQFLAAAELKAEDAAHVLQLPPEVEERLLTAARGEAELRIAGWDNAVEQVVRGNIGDAGPESIRQRLASIQPYVFSNIEQRSAGVAEDIWNHAVDTQLTADQIKAWKKELDARTAYRNKAISAAVVCTFDERFRLTSSQWAKLEPMVAKIVSECGDQFGNFFNMTPRTEWFLQSYTAFAPMAGIPDKDMKTILTDAQWRAWTGCNEYETAQEIWRNIDRSRHPQGGGN
ncbi:MAG TPA: PDZ domain-containing protein [Chthoniobacteraceae bacterium]|jgi:hypothetical protein|nr:PDZ domain-containing protein [Chthoniobacteraceae bacterium]